MDRYGVKALKNYYYKWHPTQDQNFIELAKSNEIVFKGAYYEDECLVVAFCICANFYKIVFEEGITPYQISPKKYFDKIDKDMIEDINWNFFILNSSDRLDWYYKEGEPYYGNFVAKHYVMLMGENFIEVLATYAPLFVKIAETTIDK